MNQISGELIISTSKIFITQVKQLADKATRLIAMMNALPGNLGRYVGRYNTNQANASLTIAGLIGAGSQARQAVWSACDTLLSDAQNGSYSKLPEDVSLVVSALQSANPAPNQAIEILLELQAATDYTKQLSTQLDDINIAIIDLFRRNAISAAASTTSTYSPISQEDASGMRQAICNALDIEIQRAGDAGEDASYTKLRALRVAVVQDLSSRGSNLASTQEVSTPRAVPLLAMAQKLYQDAARYDQLLNEADPIHPAFPSTSYKALLS